MTKPIKHITVACYTHPELYPPVLSALDQLARYTDGIDLLTRRMLDSHWRYPENVRVHYINKVNYKGFGIEQRPMWQKLWHFRSFVRGLKRFLIDHDSQVLMVHDVIPLYAAYLLRATLKKRGITLWYHNHDVTDKSKAGTYSLMGIAAKFEPKAFEYIDIFSLPASERLQYFPVHLLPSKPIVVPNFPLKRFYKFTTDSATPKHVIKLVFQGSIGAGHGLEALIKLLSTPINGKQLELHLVGKVRPVYLEALEALVLQAGVTTQFYYHGMQAFAKLPEFLAQFDVGLAIHEPYNVTYATGGTASNKIYEYAACGLPVLLFDNAHYRGYLEAYQWTYFTDGSLLSLTNSLSAIDQAYTQSSEAARLDFEQEFNFESRFETLIAPILKQQLLP